jgi:hypothetical protein
MPFIHTKDNPTLCLIAHSMAAGEVIRYLASHGEERMEHIAPGLLGVCANAGRIRQSVWHRSGHDTVSGQRHIPRGCGLDAGHGLCITIGPS